MQQAKAKTKKPETQPSDNSLLEVRVAERAAEIQKLFATEESTSISQVIPRGTYPAVISTIIQSIGGEFQETTTVTPSSSIRSGDKEGVSEHSIDDSVRADSTSASSVLGRLKELKLSPQAQSLSPTEQSPLTTSSLPEAKGTHVASTSHTSAMFPPDNPKRAQSLSALPRAIQTAITKILDKDKRFKRSQKEGVLFEASAYVEISDEQLRQYGIKEWTREERGIKHIVLVLEMNQDLQPSHQAYMF